MLIKFSVQNFLSVYDKQTLDMRVVESLKEPEKEHHCIAAPYYSERLLKAGVIYGANASGKSTLLNALAVMSHLVLQSQKQNVEELADDIAPFAFSAKGRAEDTEFEIEFLMGGQRYQYGFCINRVRVTEEWLFVFPTGKGKGQKWFHRAYDAEKSQYQYQFSSYFKGEKKSWEEQTRNHALFLSTALMLNSAQLKPIEGWFEHKLRVVLSADAFRVRSGLTAEWLEEAGDEGGERSEKVLQFMQDLDCGRYVLDIEVQKKLFGESRLLNKMPEKFRQLILDNNKGAVTYETKFAHPDIDTGELIYLPLADESSGTQALFGFAKSWFEMLENDQIYVIDELDTSLHPLILRALMQWFHQKSEHAQLIFTTHDTSLLSQDNFRRDQVWLVDKNDKQMTQLEPLSDYQIRQGEALEKGYLAGRYGAIPWLGV